MVRCLAPLADWTLPANELMAGDRGRRIMQQHEMLRRSCLPLATADKDELEQDLRRICAGLPEERISEIKAGWNRDA